MLIENGGWETGVKGYGAKEVLEFKEESGGRERGQWKT